MPYLLLLSIILTCIVVYFWREMKYQKNRAATYKESYLEAQEEWAKQSNAVRKKGIECGIVEKACMDWKEKYIKAEKELKELKKRLKDIRITI